MAVAVVQQLLLLAAAAVVGVVVVGGGCCSCCSGSASQLATESPEAKDGFALGAHSGERGESSGAPPARPQRGVPSAVDQARTRVRTYVCPFPIRKL